MLTCATNLRPYKGIIKKEVRQHSQQEMQQVQDEQN